MSEYIYEVTEDADGIYCYIKRGEVVRCKDCRFNQGGNKCLNKHSIIDIPKDTDYCSYGEKK